MRLRRGLSPLFSTLILISLAVAGGLIIYSVLPGLMAGLGGRLEVQVASADLIYVEDRAFFSISVKNIGNKPAAGIVVSGYDDNGKPFKLALPPAGSGGTSGNTLIIPLGVLDLVLDGSGNNNHGTIHGATWVDGKYGKALSFDGVDHYVEIPADASLTFDGEITVEAWIKPDEVDTDHSIVHGSLTGSYLYSYWIEIFRKRVVFSVNGVYEYCSFPEILEVGKWYYLVMTYDKTLPEKNIKGYVNGTLWGWKDYTGNIVNENGVKIGQTGYGRFPFDGIIDEVCIYNRASSSEENDWSFNHPGMPVTDGLVMWLPLDEGLSDPFSFTVGNSYTLTVTAYSLDGSMFTSTSSVKCTSQSR